MDHKLFDKLVVKQGFYTKSLKHIGPIINQFTKSMRKSNY